MMDPMEALNASMETVLAFAGVVAVGVGVVLGIEFELVAAPKAVVTDEEEDAVAHVDVDGVAVAAVIGTATGVATEVVSLLR